MSPSAPASSTGVLRIGSPAAARREGSLVRSLSLPDTPRPRKIMSMARRCAMAACRSCLRLAASSFFCALQPSECLAVGEDRGLSRNDCLMLDPLDAGPSELHLVADPVDLDKFLGREKAVRHHRTVDEPGARIIGGRDPIAAAKPRIGEAILAARRLLDLLARYRQKCAGTQTERLGLLER